MSRAYRRGPWVAEEDANLLSLVASRGPNNWVQISQHMHFRSPKQCRERYHQNLKSSLNHEPISVEEGEAIEQMVTEMGKKWAEIARRLGNRSDNAVKNWWNGSQHRRRRNVPGHPSRTLTNRTQPLPAVRMPRSAGRPSIRHRNYDSMSARHHHHHHHTWSDGDAAVTGERSLASDKTSSTEERYNSGHSLPHLGHTQPPPNHHYPHQRLPELPSPPALRRARAGNPPGPLLPSLGPLDTTRSPPPYSAGSAQPPYSATSMDRAPSLVSDHNSTYSISPKTWPSPRPELLVPLDTSRSRWHEAALADRRGSLPILSNIAPSLLNSDEGYLSAALPSASSESKCFLPTPIGRPASFDGPDSSIDHGHCFSSAHLSLPPFARGRNSAREPSSARDSRMNFTSLLN